MILGNVKSVTIYDKVVASNFDLSNQFYIESSDVGMKTRAQASVKKLVELNPDVDVSNYEGEINESFLGRFQVIVLVNCDDQRHFSFINEFSRKHNIGFIDAQLRGLFSRVFVDFGESHLVKDVTGKDPETFTITAISKDTNAMVQVMEKGPSLHKLEVGDIVEIIEVQGMEETNGKKAKIVKIESNHSCIIDLDTSNFKDYLSGGVVKEVFQEKTLKFKPYSEVIKNPGALDSPVFDFTKFDVQPNAHIAFQALHQFLEQHQSLPKLLDKEDAEKFLEIAKQINQKNSAQKTFSVEELDQALLINFAQYSTLQIVPMSCFLGGVVAQEVMKRTGKFKPIHQLMYYDCSELLKEWNAGEKSLTGGRQDTQIALFGDQFQHKIEKLKVFLVGSGALGCEWLKNLSMMGVGIVHVTDMDSIERTNLSRQFLFRENDVGKMKSTCGASAATKFNPQVKFTPLTQPVGPDTEDVFNSAFFDELDVVVNALDNWKARLYVDSQIVKYKKPLFERLAAHPNFQPLFSLTHFFLFFPKVELWEQQDTLKHSFQI